jgi:hypothetical protein
MSNKCAAINLDGSSCEAYAVNDSLYCWVHEPSLADKRTEARRTGGRARKYIDGIPVNIDNIDDVLDIVSEVIGNLKNMDISVSQSRALLSSAETAMKALELKELTSRVERLEELLGEKDYESSYE